MKYDRLIIGGGSDAIGDAIAAAVQGHRVALVERATSDPVGVESSVLHRAAQRIIEADSISMDEFRREVTNLLQAKRAENLAELARRGVDLYSGDVRVVDANTIALIRGSAVETLTGQTIVLACGTKSAALGSHRFDGQVILAAEDLLSLNALPPSMIVVGAGRTGLDHAIVLSKLGVEITVVDEHSNQFELCGGLMGGRLFQAQSLDIAFRLGDEVIGIEKRSVPPRAAVRLASGRMLATDAVLVCIGRDGRTDGLELEAAGIGLDERGRVWCDANGRTWVPQIMAVGDVVGFRAGNAMAG